MGKIIPKKAEATDAQQVGQRMTRLQYGHQADTGVRLTLQVVAEMVTRAHGARRFTTGMIGEYQKGQTMAANDAIAAYAKAFGADPGWLAFGPLSGAPAPRNLVADPIPRVSKGKVNRE